MIDVLDIDIDLIIERVLQRKDNEKYADKFHAFIEVLMDKRESEFVAHVEKIAFDSQKMYQRYLEAFKKTGEILNYKDSYESGLLPDVAFYEPAFEFEGKMFYKNTIEEDDKFVKDVVSVKTVKFLQRLVAEGREGESELANTPQLKWTGKPAQLGFIISELVRQGYIEAPQKKDKEINYNELARQVLAAFDIKDGSTVKSLSQSLNPNSENGQLTDDRKAKFTIPYIGMIS